MRFCGWFAGVAALVAVFLCCHTIKAAKPGPGDRTSPVKPNIVIVLADQWRAQALGYMGNKVVKTPNLDRLAATSVNCVNAVSACPVCSPMRATLLTGQRPLTHKVFINDVPLSPDAVTFAEVLKEHGYRTACIGKWHVDGHGRTSFIPRERRQGFDYWKVLECTHNYNHSLYYGDTPERRWWDGYDAIAQTKDAEQFIRSQGESEQPFMLFLSWGPPHAPYETAPESYRAMYEPEKIPLRPNIVHYLRQAARHDLAGYYAHCTALDACVGRLRKALQLAGVADRTILVFTSDHGDLLGSHQAWKKQQPYDESVRVPLLWHYPKRLGTTGRRVDAMINSEDLMPTLLGLAGVPSPASVEGLDFSQYLCGGPDPSDGMALLTCPVPFGQWARRWGGREYRALRSKRYTYARDLRGPWLLFDNQVDPYQLNNLIGQPAFDPLARQLDGKLQKKLEETHDRFLPGRDYLKQCGYSVN